MTGPSFKPWFEKRGPSWWERAKNACLLRYKRQLVMTRGILFHKGQPRPTSSATTCEFGHLSRSSGVLTSLLGTWKLCWTLCPACWSAITILHVAQGDDVTLWPSADQIMKSSARSARGLYQPPKRHMSDCLELELKKWHKTICIRPPLGGPLDSWPLIFSAWLGWR